MKRNTIWILAGFLAMVFLILGLVTRRQTESVSATSNVEALGLRGTSKVSRPLSKTQAERLETNFLDIPAPRRDSNPNGPAGVMDTVNHVESINRLNERQAK